MNKEEIKNRNKFRKVVSERCEFVRPRIDMIKNASGKDLNRGGLYNAGILYNNKMSEILHYYYKREVPFFNSSLISEIIYDHLTDLLNKAISELDTYMKDNVYAVDTFSLIKSDNNPGLLYYKEYCDQIWEFDITKEIPTILDEYLRKYIDSDNTFRYAFISHVKDYMDDVRKSLLELELENQYYECEKVIDEAGMYCDTKMKDYNQLLRKLTKIK